MSSRINTNTTATEAAYNLGINSANVAKNIERLSSGLRINSAADDASGLVISESLRAQSAGLSQATSNTNDAINVVKTAEGALNEVHALLINIRQLVVHAANVGANDPTALKANQDSIASAVASINRIAAWVIGTRAMIKALLAAMLEPIALLREAEESGDFTKRLALLEESKTLPLGAVWDYYCLKQNVPSGIDWLAEVKIHERDVLAKRG